MVTSLKELLIVLTIGTAMFYLAKPIATRFTIERDFVRRRNIWLVLTTAAFLSPNFWWFALVAAPLLWWGGRTDSNPVAFYLLLLFVVPSIPVEIPTIGINELFNLDIYRLLAFCVLIPAAWRLRRSTDIARIHRLQTIDYLLLAYGVIQVTFFVRPDLPSHINLQDSPTATLRRAFLFLVDVYSLYFVVSRSCSSRKKIIDAMGTLCLSCALLAPMAVFESLRHWLLYADVTSRWDTGRQMSLYLLRGGTLRAQVTAGHSLALGYLLAVAFGFWLYLQQYTKTALSRLTVFLLLWFGLLASYSRGPWLGAVVIYFTFVTLRPHVLPRFFKAAAAVVIVIGVVLVSPLGHKIIEVLPFMGGSVDSGSVTYRQRLAERSWQLILQHPFFGNQFVYSKMESLRQGQGIIDLVNTYAQVALFYGFVGLFLFISPFLLTLARAFQVARKFVRTESGPDGLGISLVVCMLGTLLMIAVCSFILSYTQLYYVLTGLAAAYVHIGRCLQESRTSTLVRLDSLPQANVATYARVRRQQLR